MNWMYVVIPEVAGLLFIVWGADSDDDFNISCRYAGYSGSWSGTHDRFGDWKEPLPGGRIRVNFILPHPRYNLKCCNSRKSRASNLYHMKVRQVGRFQRI